MQTRSPRPRETPAVDLGDGIWMSPGLSNSYLLADRRRSDRGQHRAWGSKARSTAGPTTPSTTRSDPGHRVHPGPLRPRGRHRQPPRRGHRADRPGELLLVAGRQRAAGDVPVAQRRLCLDAGHPGRHGAHRSRSASGTTAQARPEPTTTFDDRLELVIGGRELVLLSTPGGETTDSLVIWLPDTRTAFTRQPVRPALRARPQPGHDARATATATR